MRDIPRIFLLLVLCVSFLSAEETSNEKPALMERLVQSLPKIPNVIKGQMEGKPDELKKMISNMLGDGLLSQLVVNPMSVAENMGVPLTDLGINKTVMEKSIGMDNDGKGSTSAPFNIFSAFTPSTTTTAKVMYVDGVPIKNFDDFIRKHNLEKNGYTTLAPPTTTTPFTPEKVAEVVLERLKSRETPVLAEPPRQTPDIANSLDMNLIDPTRVAEVNQLLRRSPQRFDRVPSYGNQMDIGPPGFVQSLDPAIDEVVTNLRTKGSYGLSVDDVKRLQNILQTYEQTLQTKELLSRRKQLEVLQTELSEQRKRIEIQKKTEEDLRRKEKELEEAKKKMEEQLREQLNSWHSSFGPIMPRAPLALPEGLQLENMGSPPATMPPVTTSTEPVILQSHERKLAEEREEIVEQQLQPEPPLTKISSSLRNQIRYSPVSRTESVGNVPPSSSVKRDYDEIESNCDCEKISLEKMNGKWLMALASPNVIQKIQQKPEELLNDSESELTCSVFDVQSGKQSSVAQDARLVWQFKTSESSKLYRLRGSALTMDHQSVHVKMTDFDGDIFGFPFCVLRSGETDNSYDHLLVTNSLGNCKDVALLVRDPREFFDNPDKQLQKYLKAKISTKEMNGLEVVDFGDC